MDSKLTVTISRCILKDGIMIDVGKYTIILNEGLLLDHYAVLLSLKEGREMPKSKRIQGFVNLLCKKGYIDDGALTERANRILEGEGNPIPDVPDRRRISSLVLAGELEREEPHLKVDEKFNYADWVIQLHKKCQNKLIAGTGRPQVRDKIDGKPYPFLPNSTDLARVILRAVNVYKLKDFERIEKTILAYIDRCVKANKWFPLLNYYIMKNSMSAMVTDMESTEEETSGDDSIVNI
jgi:hypothetical protein